MMSLLALRGPLSQGLLLALLFLPGVSVPMQREEPLYYCAMLTVCLLLLPHSSLGCNPRAKCTSRQRVTFSASMTLN